MRSKFYTNMCLDNVANAIEKKCNDYRTELFKNKRKKQVNKDAVAKAEEALGNLTHGIFRFKLERRRVEISLIDASDGVFKKLGGAYETVGSRIKRLNRDFQPEELKNERVPEFHKRFHLYRCDREGQNCLL